MEASSAKQEEDREWSLREGKLENWRGEADRKAPASSPGRWDRSTLLRAAGNDLGGPGNWEPWLWFWGFWPSWNWSGQVGTRRAILAQVLRREGSLLLQPA